MIKFPYVENSDNSSTQLSVPVTVKHNKSYKESITTNTSFIYYIMLSVINLKHCYSLRINWNEYVCIYVCIYIYTCVYTYTRKIYVHEKYT